MARKLYIDFLSQPARALIVFCRAAGIEAELVPVSIAKGEQRRPEYRAVNPLGKIPCLQETGGPDGDFCLAESAAIMRYLATTNQVADHWYPAEPRARARVDSALDWHHGNVRRGSAGVVFNRVIAQMDGKQGNAAVAEASEEVLQGALQTLEGVWLRGGRFMTGDAICLADLLMATELDMLRLLVGAKEGKSFEQLLAPFPVVRAWMQRTAEATAPHYADVSQALHKVAAALERRKAREQAKI